MCEQTVIDSLENLKSMFLRLISLEKEIKSEEDTILSLKKESKNKRPSGFDGDVRKYDRWMSYLHEPNLEEYDNKNHPILKPESDKKQDVSSDEEFKIPTWLKIIGIIVLFAACVAGLIIWDIKSLHSSNANAFLPGAEKSKMLIAFIVYILATAILGGIAFFGGRFIYETFEYTLLMKIIAAPFKLIFLLFKGIYKLVSHICKRKTEKGFARAKEENRQMIEDYNTIHRAGRAAAHQKDIELYRRQDKVRQDEIASHEKSLALLNVRKATVESVIVSEPCLPGKYKSFNAVSTLLDYLTNMRADSIKEAINLYESESMQKAHNNAMRRAAEAQKEVLMRAEAERNAYIKAAAEAQQQAAYEAELQRIATQSMADNAAKQRRAAEDALDEIRDMRKQMDD